MEYMTLVVLLTLQYKVRGEVSQVYLGDEMLFLSRRIAMDSLPKIPLMSDLTDMKMSSTTETEY